MWSSSGFCIRATFVSFFHVHFNDIFSCSNYLSFTLFADDTNIFFQHKNISELTQIVNHELSFVATWFKANKLTLHPDKTKFVLFHPARKKINLNGLSISIDKNSINRVEHTEFLCVIIHQNLAWPAHIKAISSKIAKSTGIITELKHATFLSDKRQPEVNISLARTVVSPRFSS